ncbi:MAG TPA: amidase [Tepidisphaeraceae bacterium]|nr:amidase [Tepidisphaeraceae bacterium]
MNRREFLSSALLAGAAAATDGSGAVMANGPQAAREIPPFELEDVPIAQLTAGMASGKYTSRGLVEAYVSRIEALDHKRPTLRAVLEINPDALKIAEELDAERKSKGPRGQLHGVPILLKDNIDTADRMTTTAGSLALEGTIAPRDSFIAKKLREAGAVLLGKANLSEWANYRGHRSSSGWSGRGSQTRNPYALNRTPSGSSSGCAVAAAASYCAAAVGTETDGSIMSPSSACSCVGIKPTVGLISRSGVIPISKSQDTAGPIARTVEDAATLLGALTGVDPDDDATAASEGKSSRDYMTALRKDGLKDARIGVVISPPRSIHHAAQDAFKETLGTIRSAGVTLVEPVEIPSVRELGNAEGLVMSYEFKAGINAYLRGRGSSANVHSLEDLIAFNRQHAEQELPYFGQELFVESQAKGGLDAKEYLDAVQRCRECTRTNGIDRVMDQDRLDALVMVSSGPPGPIDLAYGDRDMGGTSTLAAVAGYPSITVPLGYYYGLPFGISFVGRAWSEATLIRIAYAFEQATNVRKAPRFLPDADLPA